MSEQKKEECKACEGKGERLWNGHPMGDVCPKCRGTGRRPVA